ncbi:MAG: hypothetical protein IKD36_00565 [Clostridia bacterium]|nr:hypothetical protein [Clostridia bacterium]
MSASLIILTTIILLVMFGAGQRILDSLRLNDKEALMILVLICIGILIPPIWIGKYFCFSIGGFLIPLGLSIYLLISCGWSRDLLRAFFGTIIVASLIYALEWLLPADPEEVLIDNMYVYGVVAGVVAYALGRSRRNAFVSCLFGITLAQLVQWIINFSKDVPTVLGLGVGGAFGAYIVSIVIAVAVSEFLGRCFENAAIKKETKNFNYKTHTFDSVKNGKLNKIAYDKTNLKNAKSVKNEENTATTSEFYLNNVKGGDL